MLIAHLLNLMRTDRNPSEATASRLSELFDYVRHPIDNDTWRTRNEAASNIVNNGGRLVGNCADHAFTAAYALHDLGVGARVVTGADEMGEGHMVCEDERGWVIDNRYPGRLLTWDELEHIGYRSARMNDLNFESGGPRDWHFVKIGADGKRDYT